MKGNYEKEYNQSANFFLKIDLFLNLSDLFKTTVCFNKIKPNEDWCELQN